MLVFSPDGGGRTVQDVSIGAEMVRWQVVAHGFLEGYNVEGGKFAGRLMSLPAMLGPGYVAYERDAQASGAPEFAKEGRRLTTWPTRSSPASAI